MKDQAFWTQLFGTASTIAVTMRYALSLWKKKIQTQTIADMSIERFKSTQAGKLVVTLERAVERLDPLVKEQGEKLERFGKSVEQVKIVESNMVGMMKDLKLQYDNFQTTITNVHAGGSAIIKRLENFETELTYLRNGKVFVKGKK